MNMSNVTKVLKTIGTGINKHKPAILTGMGIAAGVTSTVLAVKATPDAMESIKMAEEEKGEKLTKMEVVKATWKHYIPAITTGVTAGVCVIGANAVHNKRSAALATACQISATALNEYKEKTIETVGEEAEKQIREKIVKDKEKKNEIKAAEKGENHTVILSEDGEVIIREPISGQQFRSSKEDVKSIKNDINGRMIDGDMYASFNEFLRALNLDDYILGDEIGWTVNRRIDLTFDLGETKSGKPCFVIAYLTPPQHGYDSLH